MSREAGFGVNRLSTKRVHHTAKNARFHGYRRGYLAGYRPSKADSPALRAVQRSRSENCAFHGGQVGESPANALGRGAGGNQSSIAGLHHLAQPQHGVRVAVTSHGHRLRRRNRGLQCGASAGHDLRSPTAQSRPGCCGRAAQQLAMHRAMGAQALVLGAQQRACD